MVDYTARVRKLSTKVQRYSRSNSSSYGWLDEPIISWEVQRVAEDTKFFGQVVTHRLNLKMRPAETTEYSTDDRWRIRIYNPDDETDYNTLFGYFYTTEVHTDENNNIKSITAYDKIKLFEDLTVSDLNLTPPYTVQQFANAISRTNSSYNAVFTNIDSDLLSLSFSVGANLEGTENLVECLQWIAELLNAVCFVNSDSRLEFKCLDKDGDTYTSITKADYITCSTSGNKRLGKIIYATELGENVEAHTVAEGSTQVVRNNAFLDNRPDRATLVQNAINSMGGLTIGTFDMKWRGNPTLPIGEKLKITLKDNTEMTTYLLDETISFDGGLSSKLRFHWDQNKEENDDANPATIGEAINQTYAKVDKINKQIDLVIEDVADNTEEISGITSDLTSVRQRVTTNENNISSLQLTTDSITSTVAGHTSSIETITETTIPAIESSINNIEVGARNLAKKTAGTKTFTASGSNSYCTPLNVYATSDYGLQLLADTSIEKFTVSFDWTATNADTATNAGMYLKYTSNAYSSVGATFKILVGSSSGHCVKTFTPSAGQRQYGVSWAVMGISTANRDIQITISNFKFEAGNKATSWTVAPEDTDGDITAAQNAADAAQGTADGIRTDLTTTQTQVTTNKNDISQLKIDKQSIEQRVGSTETSITTITTTTIPAVQANIDNLQVGGRNLLLDTADAYTTEGSASESVYTKYYNLSNYGKTLLNTLDYFTVSFDYEVTGNSSTTAVVYWQYAGLIGNYERLDVYTNPSGRYVQTKKLSSSQVSSSTKKGRVRLQNATDGATVKITNLKFEVGNKATTYTLAPEDVDSDIATAQATADGVRSDLTTTQTQVQTNKENIATLTTTTSGITGRVSSLESSNTTNTAAIGTLQTYVNQLDVGGRNLLIDTNAPSLTKVAAPADRYFANSSVSYITPSIVELSDAPLNITYGARFVVSATGTSNRNLSFYDGSNYVALVDGESYTISFYARVTNGSKMEVRPFYYRSNNIAIATEDITNSDWKRFNYTFTYDASACGDSNGTGARVYFGGRATYLGTLEICGFKLEQGTIGTEYTPAPEDVDYKVYVAQNTADTATENISSVTQRVSTLETTSGSISATVSSHTSSISTLTTNVGTAQTDITSLQTSLNNLGTRNYFINTLNPDASSAAKYPRLVGQTQNTATTSSATKTEAEHGIKITSSAAARPSIRFGNSTASSATMNGLTAGETYTISFDYSLKVLSGTLDNTTTYYARVQLFTDTTTTGTFPSSDGTGTAYKNFQTIANSKRGTVLSGRCVWTFTIPDNTTICYLRIVSCNLTTTSAYAAGDYMEIRNLQLERGFSASDYCPAPEDYQNSIDTVQATLSTDISNTQSSIDTITGNVSTLTTDLDGVKDDLTTTTSTLTTQINEISQQVNMRMTETDVTIAIQEAINNGVKSIETETGYKFDKDGLTISKSDSDLSTIVDNTGMTVSNQFEDVLKATAAGVETVNLVARNYIDIGTRSRIMDYKTDATGIFWIGD